MTEEGGIAAQVLSCVCVREENQILTSWALTGWIRKKLLGRAKLAY